MHTIYLNEKSSKKHKIGKPHAIAKSCDFQERIGYKIVGCWTLARNIKKNPSTDLDSIAPKKHCIFCKRNGHDYTKCQQIHRRLLDGSISVSDTQVFFSNRHNTSDFNRNHNAPMQRTVRFADNQSSYNSVPRNSNYNNNSYAFNRNNDSNRNHEYPTRSERLNYTPYNRYNYQNQKKRFSENNFQNYKKTRIK